MLDQLKQIKIAAESEITTCGSNSDLENLRIKYLGKKGELTAILRGMGSLTPEERPVFGAAANDARVFIEALIETRSGVMNALELEKRLIAEKLDVTLPGKTKKIGKEHPLRQTEQRMREIFIGMGFDIAEGPEVESVFNNFDALNAPKDHPSRDYTDTFYIGENAVLRTQTSPVQIRVMQESKPPIRVISPGRVYRCDPPDATHSPVFHQLEGLVVDKNITMGDLKGTLELFAKSLFGEETRIRFRPHNFPFTEPSAEVDFSCFMCGGSGCRLCKNEGWIEMLGAGMVHPNVLRVCGIDPEIYSGFAFGVGIERVAMRMYSISDMRLFYENDLRFLEQF